MSTSYGEEEQSVPQEFALKICNMFHAAGGARRVGAVLVGRLGPPGRCACAWADSKPFFQPSFPAAAPS